MKKKWHDTAWEQYLYWQTQDKRTLKKINSLLKDIDRNGYNCGGHQEALSGNLSGFHSVEIDEKNRIVFMIVKNGNEDELIIIQCGGHYDDK